MNVSKILMNKTKSKKLSDIDILRAHLLGDFNSYFVLDTQQNKVKIKNSYIYLVIDSLTNEISSLFINGFDTIKNKYINYFNIVEHVNNINLTQHKTLDISFYKNNKYISIKNALIYDTIFKTFLTFNNTILLLVMINIINSDIICWKIMKIKIKIE